MSRLVSEPGRYHQERGMGRGRGMVRGMEMGRGMVRGRGRGGGTRGGRPPWAKATSYLCGTPPLTLNDYPRGPVLAEWVSNELRPEEDENSEILTKKNYELLASYNWLPLGRKDGSAALVVPGLPARWTPPPLPAWLTPDSGLYFIDQNGYRNPASPLEPALLALFTLHPTFDPNPIDIISDRNNLRKLMRFVRARKHKKFMRDFKIYVEVVNKTVLLTRWETITSHVITENDFGGFGHSFERDFTKHTQGLEESSAHNRLASYNFGGLNIMVRFSADAFLSSKTATKVNSPTIGATAAASSPRANGLQDIVPHNDRTIDHPKAQSYTKKTGLTGRGNEAQVEPGATKHNKPEGKLNGVKPGKVLQVQSTLLDTDDLASFLATTLTLEQTPKPKPQPPTRAPEALQLQSKLQVIKRGMLMPQDRVVEIKTRPENKRIDLTDQIPQLWFSGTSNLYVGYHQMGNITSVDTEAMGAKAMAMWEAQEENQADLAKLKVLLQEIVNLARNSKEGKGQLAAVGGTMKFYSNAEGEVAIGTLPLYIRKRWDV